MMRTLIMCGIGILAVSCGAGHITPRPSAPRPERAPDADQLAAIMYFIDGRTASSANVHALARDSISDVQLIKGGAAVEQFGFAGFAGVMMVRTKRPSPAATSEPNPFYFIDGRTASRDDVMLLARDSIARVELLKGEAARTMYGPASRDGVVLVSRKTR